MKENTLDILMHLFENYANDEQLVLQDKTMLKADLHEAGFSKKGVKKALDWLDDLASAQERIAEEPQTTTDSIRVYNRNESNRFDIECQGFLIFLENLGVLDSITRELVIARSFALEEEDIGLEQLKWVTLMVLFNQPEQEANFTWMEDFIYEAEHTNLH